MKIERTPNDKNIEQYIKDGTIGGPITERGSISLNIEVTDPVKASNFLLQYALLGRDSSILEDTCGFKITSINLFMAKDTSYILDELEKLEQYLSSREVSPGVTI